MPTNLEDLGPIQEAVEKFSKSVLKSTESLKLLNDKCGAAAMALEQEERCSEGIANTVLLVQMLKNMGMIGSANAGLLAIVVLQLDKLNKAMEGTRQ